MQSLFKNSLIRQCFALLFVLALFAPAAVQAQVKKFSGDVSANVGFNNLTGIDGKKHPEFGFSGGFNVIKQLAIVGEFNYLPQGSATQSNINVNANYQFYGAAVRYSPFPNYRVVPFISYGEGYARVAASASAGSSSAHASLNGSYFGFGGGGSIYITHNLGLRPEFRWDRQTYTQNGNSASQNDVRGMIAVFFQWGGRSDSGAAKTSSSLSN
jgi:Outer membrane protein beta-barrel domain